MSIDQELLKVWEDQKEFNSNFWPEPSGSEDRAMQTKEFVLYTISELDEVLRKVNFKIHRRTKVKENRAAVIEELTDVFKYVVSLYQVWDVSPEELVEAYWHKSMAVRQRYSEEFMKEIDGPCAIIDIDNVLADYTNGILTWIRIRHPEIKFQYGDGLWLNARRLKITESMWQQIKHEFRISGGKKALAPVPGALEFLHRVNTAGLKIVLITSRPIDEYPNIYADTLSWLNRHKMPYDYLWWAKDKDELVLSKGILPHVRFCVDDHLPYCNGFAKLGLKTYWLTDSITTPSGVIRVNSLDEIEI